MESNTCKRSTFDTSNQEYSIVPMIGPPIGTERITIIGQVTSISLCEYNNADM